MAIDLNKDKNEIKRGNSGWYQIIPFYVLWMLFAEGDKEANEYGNPPKE